jgi:hypothetical protein
MTTTELTGYQKMIARAIGNRDHTIVALIEDLMRNHTGGALDGLTAIEFLQQAQTCHAEMLAWHRAGEIDGMTLAEYCRIVGLVYPELTV